MLKPQVWVKRPWFKHIKNDKLSIKMNFFSKKTLVFIISDHFLSIKWKFPKSGKSQQITFCDCVLWVKHLYKWRRFFVILESPTFLQYYFSKTNRFKMVPWWTRCSGTPSATSSSSTVASTEIENWHGPRVINLLSDTLRDLDKISKGLLITLGPF